MTGWPLDLNVPRAHVPNVAEIGNAFNEGVKDVEADLREIPKVVRNWRWMHTALMSCLIVLVCAGLMGLGAFLRGKPEAPRDVVSLGVHNTVRQALEARGNELAAAKSDLKAARIETGRALARIKELETQLEISQRGLRSDADVDKLNRK